MGLRGVGSLGCFGVAARVTAVGIVAAFVPQVLGTGSSILAFCVAFLGDALFGLVEGMPLRALYDLSGEQVLARSVSLGIGGAASLGLVVMGGFLVFHALSRALAVTIPAFVLADLGWQVGVQPVVVRHFGLSGAYEFRPGPAGVDSALMSPDTAGFSVLLMSVLVGLGFGLVFLLVGWAVRSGRTKRYSLVSRSDAFWRQANYHFLPVLGVLMSLFGLSALLPSVDLRRMVLAYGLLAAFILAFIVGFWQPWWLKPKWIRQLEENHPDLYPFLQEAAQEEVGTDRKKADEWASKMDTVESQNEWVAEVRKRLGMPDPSAAKRAGDSENH